MPVINTEGSLISLINISALDLNLIRPSKAKKMAQMVFKSQSMFMILSFLRRSQIFELQAVCKRFYNVLIPQLVNLVQLPLPPQFIMLDTSNKELHTFYIDESLNPNQEWLKRPVSPPIYGGFKIVATTERGGRYFLCGGSRTKCIK
jgi:hypothetical protein